MKDYNPLYDDNLVSYFSSKYIRKHLETLGFINKKGNILQDPDNRKLSIVDSKKLKKMYENEKNYLQKIRDKEEKLKLQIKNLLQGNNIIKNGDIKEIEKLTKVYNYYPLSQKKLPSINDYKNSINENIKINSDIYLKEIQIEKNSKKNTYTNKSIRKLERNPVSNSISYNMVNTESQLGKVMGLEDKISNDDRGKKIILFSGKKKYNISANKENEKNVNHNKINNSSSPINKRQSNLSNSIFITNTNIRNTGDKINSKILSDKIQSIRSRKLDNPIQRSDSRSNKSKIEKISSEEIAKEKNDCSLVNIDLNNNELDSKSLNQFNNDNELIGKSVSNDNSNLINDKEEENKSRLIAENNEDKIVENNDDKIVENKEANIVENNQLNITENNQENIVENIEISEALNEMQNDKKNEKEEKEEKKEEEEIGFENIFAS